ETRRPACNKNRPPGLLRHKFQATARLTRSDKSCIPSGKVHKAIQTLFLRLLARRDISCARERTFFCARPRTTDVGAREMPRSVLTAGPLCNEGKFAKEFARFAN